jgi:predicted nucleic acid-binding protein
MAARTTIFVMDASVTLAWAFEDETTPYTEEALDRLTQGRAIVPTIWPLEVGNALVVAERRGRLKEADTVRFLSLLRQLPIVVEAEATERVFSEVVRLAREHHLSTYDASYLDLAMRLGVPLATQDENLRRVAARCGVKMVQARTP